MENGSLLNLGKWPEVARAISHLTEHLGMRKPPVGSMSANLGDIYEEGEECMNLIAALPSADARRHREMGGFLIELREGVSGHIGWHIKDIRKDLDRVINYCLDTKQRPGAWRESLQEALSVRKCDNARLAEGIKSKMVQLRRRPGTAMVIGTYLAAIHEDLKRYLELVDQFLGTDPRERKAIGTILADIKVVLQHIYDHMAQARPPLQWVINYCYQDELDDKITRRLEALGIRDRDAYDLSWDISDIYREAERCAELMNTLSSAGIEDRKKAGEILAAYREVIFDNVEWHVRDGLKELGRAIKHRTGNNLISEIQAPIGQGAGETNYSELAAKIERRMVQLGIGHVLARRTGEGLASICAELDKFSRLVDKFLEADAGEEKEKSDTLTGMRTVLKRINDDLRKIKVPLHRTIDCCYSEGG